MAKAPDRPKDDSELEPWERELQEQQAKLSPPQPPVPPPVKVPPIAAKPKVVANEKLPITKVPGPRRKFQ